MRIVTKINLALAAVVGVSALLNFAALQATVAPRFNQIEDETAQRNQDRALEAIQLQQGQVAASARDYAFWDDTFSFMHGENASYEVKNLNAESMKALNVNFYLALEPDGGVKIDKGFDFSAGEPAELKLTSETRFPAGHPYLAEFPEAGSRTGLVNTKHGVVAVGYAPILDSERNGPRAGTLLFGKIIDLDLLRETTKVDFELRPFAGAIASNSMVHSDDAIEVTSTLMDVEGKPIADLVSKTSRSISSAGHQAVWAALALLLLAGGALIASLAVILRRIALKRIAGMREHLVQIKSTGTLHPLPADSRRDELSEMVTAFNDMAAQLEELREQLRRQDYQHGAADQAAEVLHNIRNAVSPIAAIISDLADETDARWRDNLDKALGELKNGRIDLERREKLNQFVSLSAAKLLEAERKRHSDVATLKGIVRHVDRILKDGEALSRAERIAEPIDLARQLRAFASVAGRRPGVSIEFDIADDVCVLGHRIPLEQVWGNLLINAAEAIEATGRGEGTIRVRVVEAELNGAPAAEIQIIDDGDGFPPDASERIFQKGFSTRRERSGGLGLHWCANAVGAMGGRLFAESDGPGRGATLRLVLPKARAGLRSAA